MLPVPNVSALQSWDTSKMNSSYFPDFCVPGNQELLLLIRKAKASNNSNSSSSSSKILVLPTIVMRGRCVSHLPIPEVPNVTVPEVKS
mmetsp:Transcript_31214/g.89171  ORF Transcript_31214/g.89171 Transcript_31214/m.89171 type:complete len:88 (-) Transcript_31214:41-304(-)